MSEEQKENILETGKRIEKRMSDLKIPPNEIEMIFNHVIKWWQIKSEKHGHRFVDLLNK